jgi:hypothetical protein
MVQCFLIVQNRATGNASSFQFGEGNGRFSFPTPSSHSLTQHIPVLAARHIISKTRVSQPMLFAHQPRPPLKNIRANHLHNNEAILGGENIGRASDLAAVARRYAVGLSEGLLDQHAVSHRHRSCQQRSFDHLSTACLLPLHECS